jgi:hypothetical protein
MGDVGTFLQTLASQWVGLMSGIVSLGTDLYLEDLKNSEKEGDWSDSEDTRLLQKTPQRNFKLRHYRLLS